MLKSSILKAGLIYFTLGALVFLALVLSHILGHDGQAQAIESTVITKTLPVAQAAQTVVSGHPVKLSIPRLHITLNIIDGTYNPVTKAWSLTNDKAQFATITNLPNNIAGDTLIYGHDTSAVFYGTYALQPDDELLIYTDNNHIFQYAYASSTITSPSNTSIFSYHGGPQVTLLTCSGWFSTTRRLMYFTFIKVDQ